MSRVTRDSRPADVLVACYAALDGWGGGLTLGRGSLAACARLGVSARLVGVARAGKRDSRDEAPLPEGGRFWRFRPLWVARHLASWLRAQPTPRLLVAVSPYWVVAARRTWPDVPIAYLYPCLLTNCLPFTLPAWRSWSDWLYLQLVQRIEREALRAATRVLVPTHAAAEELTAFAPADTRKVQRVEFGCVAPRISSELRWRKRSELGIARDEFLLLLSGVMDRNKAFDFALAELPRCVPRVRLLVSGDGPLRGRLERLTVERGLSERVIFAGGHPAQDALVAACDAAISTSYYDTYPNVLLEALSAGRPIVAPRHDPPCVFAGIGEAILPGGGLLYDRAENGALAAAINALAADPFLYSRHARTARGRGQRMHWGHTARTFGQLMGIAEPPSDPAATSSNERDDAPETPASSSHVAAQMQTTAAHGVSDDN